MSTLQTPASERAREDPRFVIAVLRVRQVRGWCSWGDRSAGAGAAGAAGGCCVGGGRGCAPSWLPVLTRRRAGAAGRCCWCRWSCDGVPGRVTECSGGNSAGGAASPVVVTPPVDIGPATTAMRRSNPLPMGRLIDRRLCRVARSWENSLPETIPPETVSLSGTSVLAADEQRWSRCAAVPIEAANASLVLNVFMMVSSSSVF